MEEIDWTQSTHTLSAEIIHYCINVHRTTAGTSLLISDGAGKEATFILQSDAGAWTVQQVGDITSSYNVAPVTVFFGIPKGDKLDRVVRQLSELGVAQIVLVKLARNVVVLNGPRLSKRIERLRRVASEAARQSGRSSLLDIVGPLDLSDAIHIAQTFDHAFFCQPTALRSMPVMQAGQRCGIFVGPEGGFSPVECDRLTTEGVAGVLLGHTVLRTETAAVVAATTALTRLNYL